MTNATGKTLRIKLTKSLISSKQKQRGTVHALGLKRVNDVVEHQDTPVIRGMINKVSHLVTVEEV